MKDKAKVQLTQDMKRVLNEQRLGFIASVCPDGQRFTPVDHPRIRNENREQERCPL